MASKKCIMKKSIKSFYSNELEILVKTLKENIFENSFFSEKRVVVVPSIAIKNFILEKIALSEQKVASFINFVLLDQIDHFLTSFFLKDNSLYPSYLDLFFAIEKEIKKLNVKRALHSDIAHFDEVDSFFSDQKSSYDKKLFYLSNRLSKLFIKYMVFGSPFKKGKKECFQSHIWKNIFSHFCYLQRDFKKALNLNFSSIHLFAIAFLPEIYHRLFASMDLSVYHYLLSPCLNYWEDLISSNDKFYLFKKLQNEKKKLLLDEYFSDTNLLLSNFGKLFRENLKLFKDDEIQQFEEYGLDQESSDSTLLKALKRDLLFLENPHKREKIDLSDSGSIQIHACSSKYREVEVLYDFILKILSENKDIRPSDIMVVSPNIEQYAPYIHLLFEDSIKYKILGLSSVNISFFSQTLIKILEYLTSSFSLDGFLDLLNSPLILEKFNITKEEFFLIKKWLKKANISWGVDDRHCREILDIKNNDSQVFDKTWQKGLKRILFSSVFHLEDGSEIENTDIECLDKLLNFFSNLENCRDKIKHTDRTLDKWALFFREIESVFLSLNNLNSSEENAYLSFQSFLNSLEETHEKIGFTTSYYTIFKLLKKAVENNFSSFQANLLEAVSFANISSAVPKKIICAVGFNENSFPLEDRDNLNLLNDLSIYTPKMADVNRYQVLQLVLFAKKKLYLSYLNIDAADGKEANPSVMLQEILFYLDSFFTIDNQKFSSLYNFKHFAFGFDKNYFSKKDAMNSLSVKNYHAAKAFYVEKREKIDSFEMKQAAPLEKTVDLKSLILLSSNPVKFYFNEVLKIFLEKEPSQKEMDELIMPALDKFLLRRSFLSSDLSLLWDEMKKKGSLPSGPFADALFCELEQEYLLYQKNLQKLEMVQTDFYSVEMKGFLTGQKKEKDTLYRSSVKVNVDGEVIEIVGTLSNVTKRGFLVPSSFSFFSLLKKWPEFLIYLSAEGKDSPDIIFLKDLKIKKASFDPEKALGSFLNYYQLCKSQVSFLTADLAKFLFEGQIDKFSQHWKEKSFGYKDVYFERFLSMRQSLCPKSVFEKWRPIILKTHSDFFNFYEEKPWVKNLIV